MHSVVLVLLCTWTVRTFPLEGLPPSLPQPMSAASFTPPGYDPDVFMSLPLELQAELLAESLVGAIPAPAAPALPDEAFPATVMTYNAWFRDLHMRQRIDAILTIIESKQPTFLSLQEVVDDMLPQLRPRLTAAGYHIYDWRGCPVPYGVLLCSRVKFSEFSVHPFKNSIMGRALLCGVARFKVSRRSGSSGPSAGSAPVTFVVGTSHLESVVDAKARREVERRQQMAESFEILQSTAKRVAAGSSDRVVQLLFGDVNWQDPVKRGNVWDGPVPLPSHSGWKDAWSACPPTLRFPANDTDGFTYDQLNNPMLSGKLRYRSDRIFVAGGDVDGCQMLGMSPIPGLFHESTNPYTLAVKTLPVLPSDHFGLYALLRITGISADGAAAAAVVVPASSSAPAVSGAGSSMHAKKHKHDDDNTVGVADDATAAPVAAKRARSSADGCGKGGASASGTVDDPVCVDDSD